MAKSKAAEMKIKKKKWIQIITPMFNNQVIGETTVVDTGLALHKTLKISLMHLIGDPKRMATFVEFETDQQKGETAVTASAIGYGVQEPVLRKMVRRGKTKISDSFKCNTADKLPVVLKTFLLCKSLVKQDVSTRIRLTVRQFAVNYASANTFESLLNSIVQGKLQKEIRDLANKIYPTRFVEFRAVEILKNPRGAFEKPAPLDDKIMKGKRELKMKEPKEAEEEEKAEDGEEPLQDESPQEEVVQENPEEEAVQEEQAEDAQDEKEPSL